MVETSIIVTCPQAKASQRVNEKIMIKTRDKNQ